MWCASKLLALRSLYAARLFPGQSSATAYSYYIVSTQIYIQYILTKTQCDNYICICEADIYMVGFLSAYGKVINRYSVYVSCSFSFANTLIPHQLEYSHQSHIIYFRNKSDG